MGMSRTATQIKADIRERRKTLSLRAKGLWSECVDMIQHSNKPGCLQRDGKRITDAQLARLAGCALSRLPALMHQLIDAGLIEETDDGYCSPQLRRLVEVRASQRRRKRD